MNLKFTHHILKTILDCGVEDFCLCPGSRNAPLVSVLAKAKEENHPQVHLYCWFEERSAAFFALGKSRAVKRPVAVITTSGTAAGELLPAAMEAHYSGVPLLLITADRPRHYRNTGAPQCAEQVGIFGSYAHYFEDLSYDQTSSLYLWKQTGPAHINVCLDEPLHITQHAPLPLTKRNSSAMISPNQDEERQSLAEFLKKSKCPFVVVGTLPERDKDAVMQFLLHLQAPVFVEALSGLREEPALFPLKVMQPTNLLQRASASEYNIDCVLRIGSVPTFRPWRDLENRTDISVCSISHLPFSGLSKGQIIHTPLDSFFKNFQIPLRNTHLQLAQNWLQIEADEAIKRDHWYIKNPNRELSFLHKLSKVIPEGSLVYLGNSLPIREWDLAATTQSRGFTFYANRGLNGIDGQLSTFFGLCSPDRENWAILGDLTTLYDMAGPWILKDMQEYCITIVVINNSGGQIFADKFPEKIFLHGHALNFEAFAKMWGLEYMCLREIPDKLARAKKHTLIELVPESQNHGD